MPRCCRRLGELGSCSGCVCVSSAELVEVRSVGDGDGDGG